jgi:hypothetical protein
VGLNCDKWEEEWERPVQTCGEMKVLMKLFVSNNYYKDL